MGELTKERVIRINSQVQNSGCDHLVTCTVEEMSQNGMATCNYEVTDCVY